MAHGTTIVQVTGFAFLYHHSHNSTQRRVWKHFSWCQRQAPTNYLNSGANANEIKWVLYPEQNSDVPHKWLTAPSSSTTGVRLWTAVPLPVGSRVLRCVVHCNSLRHGNVWKLLYFPNIPLTAIIAPKVVSFSVTLFSLISVVIFRAFKRRQ